MGCRLPNEADEGAVARRPLLQDNVLLVARRPSPQRSLSLFDDRGSRFIPSTHELTQGLLLKDLLSSAVGASPTGILAVDSSSAIVFVNPQIERIFGYRAEELIGRPLETLLPQRTRKTHAAHVKDFFVEPETRRLGVGRELYGLHKDGREIPVEIALTPIQRQQGTVILATIIDITERKRAQDQMRETEQRFRELAENIRDVFFVMDPKTGRALYVSPAYEEVFGHSRQHAYATPYAWMEAIHPEDRDAASAAEQKASQTGVFSAITYRTVRPDKTIRWVRVRATPVRDTAGGVVRLVGIAEDITDLKRTEEQLLHAQKMEAVGRLAGGVAHDFNNLLTAIFGYADLLGKKLAAESREMQDLVEISKAATQAASLTTQLLAFSRRQLLQPVVLNLNELLQDMEKMLRRLIGEDVALTLTLAPGIGNVRADAGQVQQVVMNLVVNARDAMPTGGRLLIETANVELTEEYAEHHQPVSPGPYVLLAVSDTGSGMDAETQAQIFEPFFTTKEKGRGTGLGLATVYGIVRQTGGTVWVYSEPDHGTTFKIYLPRADAPADGLALARDAAPSLVGSETILLAEDDATLRPLMKQLLERNGYGVLEAANAEQALAIAREHVSPIHLLVTDVVMPGASGRELARRLGEMRPEARVLYVSGYTDEAIVHHGMVEPGLAFLQKPFTPDTLGLKVRQVLGGGA
jgi:PAS domain S-box-containing protein